MYFDAVLDENYKPLYNAPPVDVKQWIQSRIDEGVEDLSELRVAIGSTMAVVTIDEYMAS